MADVPVIIDHNGNERHLGLLPPNDEALAHRKACVSFAELLEAKKLKLLPRDQYKKISRRSVFDSRFINNQQNSSGCVGWSAALCEMRARYSRGNKFERLSGAYIYAHINGGRDAGASISDSLKAGQQYGYCLESEFDLPNIYLNQIPEAAKNSALTRQAGLSYPLANAAEAFTAISIGAAIQYGYFVSRNYNSFTNGVCGITNGGYANHSVGADGMDFLNGHWCFDHFGTWGKWGPNQDGRAYHDERAAIFGDAYAHFDNEVKL